MMKKITLLQFLAYLFLTISITLPATAQVGIGTTTPAPGAILDITSTDEGILIPRVDILDLATSAPVATPTEGVMVYNTNTTTGPGFFYWDGTAWSSIGGSSEEPHDWYEVGSSPVACPDDINDNKYTHGQVVINRTAPYSATERFTVEGNLDERAINGYASGMGTAVYAENTGDGNAMQAISAGTGAAIYVDNDGGYDAIEAHTNSSTIYNALWATNTSTTGTAILAGSGSTSVVPTAGTGIAGSGLNMGIYAFATDASSGNAAGGFNLDTDGDPENGGTIASAELAGYNSGMNPDDNDGNPIGSNAGYYGGYFNGWGAYAYVGLYHDFNPSGNGGTYYKIVGNGSNSTLIDDAEGKPRVLFSPEAPEILFQDFGVGKMINGEARIEIDPVLKQALHVDEEHPLKVFITLEGDCNGVYVTDKSIDGFTVKELNGGNSNVSFSWQLVANRADRVDENGNVQSKHVGVRLPYGPEPLPERKAKSKKNEKLGTQK